MKPYYQQEWPPKGVKWYYADSAVCIAHGDCREIVPQLGRFSLLLTDPPYGIEADNRRRILSRGKLAAATDYGESNWDAAPVSTELLKMVRGLCEKQIVWGGNYFELPPCVGPMVWDKLNGSNDFADGELAWNNLGTALRIYRHRWNGMIRKGHETRVHPTQKPLALMKWCIGLAGDVQTILDPFMGSGTTLVAAKQLGRFAVGIEREEQYCEIAVKRLSQEYLPLSFPSSCGKTDKGIQDYQSDSLFGAS